jgi:surface antigen
VARRVRRAPRRALAIAAIALIALPLAAARASAASGGAGLQVLCSRSDYGCVTGTGYKGQSVWGANYGKTGHNCTSYVSYRLRQAGAAEPWHTMGNAGQWDDRGRGKVTVDGIPAPGAVAEWDGRTRYSRGSSGHVAFVESVTPTSIEITEDQFGGNTRRVVISAGSAYWPTHFIHIKDAGPLTTMAQGAVAMAHGLRTPVSPPSVEPLGTTGDTAVAGDWNGDGKDTLGTFRNGTWTLYGKQDGQARIATAQLGAPGDIPVVGDWDGDGTDDLGVFRAGEWYLRTPTSADPQHLVQVTFGAPGDIPVVGDWDGDGTSGLAVFHDGHWLFTNDLYGSAPHRYAMTFGQAGDLPVAGRWNGKAAAGVGVYRAGQWTLTRLLAPGEAVTNPRTASFGDATGLPLVGNWDGKGADGLAVAH